MLMRFKFLAPRLCYSGFGSNGGSNSGKNLFGRLGYDPHWSLCHDLLGVPDLYMYTATVVLSSFVMLVGITGMVGELRDVTISLAFGVPTLFLQLLIFNYALGAPELLREAIEQELKVFNPHRLFVSVSSGKIKNDRVETIVRGAADMYKGSAAGAEIAMQIQSNGAEVLKYVLTYLTKGGHIMEGCCYELYSCRNSDGAFSEWTIAAMCLLDARYFLAAYFDQGLAVRDDSSRGRFVLRQVYVTSPSARLCTLIEKKDGKRRHWQIYSDDELITKLGGNEFQKLEGHKSPVACQANASSLPVSASPTTLGATGADLKVAAADMKTTE